jgi:phosphoribosyl 1,2-cyclic phosphodiesterase
MSLEICVLASGSSGNCSAVRTPDGIMLIDLGLGPRVTAQRLAGTGVDLDGVRAICLTHLDRDHFRPSWSRFIVERGIKVFCHGLRRPDAVAIVDSFSRTLRRPVDVKAFVHLVHSFDGRAFHPLPGLQVQPIHCDHDDLGSHGFVIECRGRRLGYATDLGRVPPRLLQLFSDLDILALESNYDPQMELASARPSYLKNRIMGGRGHLSNDQAFSAICQILDRAQVLRRRLPDHIVLLHRSQECNCPKLLRKLFTRDPRIAPRLTLAEQDRRSHWLAPASPELRPGQQLTLAWAR